LSHQRFAERPIRSLFALYTVLASRLVFVPNEDGQPRRRVFFDEFLSLVSPEACESFFEKFILVYLATDGILLHLSSRSVPPGFVTATPFSVDCGEPGFLASAYVSIPGVVLAVPEWFFGRTQILSFCFFDR